MLRYTYLTYRQYGHLLKDFFIHLKSIFKNETYQGVYKIYMPSDFNRIHPIIELPSTTVAVLWVSFLYDTIDGKQTLDRFCCLDNSGYRIPDNSIRQFNECVDAWLDLVYNLKENDPNKINF